MYYNVQHVSLGLVVRQSGGLMSVRRETAQSARWHADTSDRTRATAHSCPKSKQSVYLCIPSSTYLCIDSMSGIYVYNLPNHRKTIIQTRSDNDQNMYNPFC